MSKNIGDTTVDTIYRFKEQIERTLKPCLSLEEAAQTFTNLLYEEFEDSIILVRFFATIPFKNLPAPNQTFVLRLADQEEVTSLVHADTFVLTLLGACGGEEMRNVKQYFGVPLVSADFIKSFPLLSALLQELGFTLNGVPELRTINPKNGDIETQSVGFLSGVFYVPDAQHAVSATGEKLLATTDRIAAYNPESFATVQTIFGIGGAYINGPFIVIMIFTNEQLERKTVEQFMPVASYFKTSTLNLVLEGKLFAS